MYHNKNRGFSLVEILLFLAIVGIVASTALPKINSTQGIDDFSVTRTAGEFDSAVRMARAQWFANGQTGSGLIDGYGDGHLWSGERGWPIGYKSARDQAKLSVENCAGVWNGLMGEDIPQASSEAFSDLTVNSDDRSGVCSYTLQKGEKKGIIVYSTLTGKVSYF